MLFGFNSLKVSWQEALSTLKPKQLGQLLLVSVRTLFALYGALLFAWFLPTALLVGLVFNIKSLIYAFFITLLARAARPSIDKKRSRYWQHFVIADWVLFFGLQLLFEIPRLLAPHVGGHFIYSAALLASTFLLKAFFLEGHAWLPGADMLGVFTAFLSPFVIIWVLFMLDAQQTVWQYVKAFGRAFTMIVYNYPFFLVIYELIRLAQSGVYLLSRLFIESYPSLGLVGWIFFLGIFVPYYVCFITNFYVKRLHDQFGNYYKS